MAENHAGRETDGPFAGRGVNDAHEAVAAAAREGYAFFSLHCCHAEAQLP